MVNKDLNPNKNNNLSDKSLDSLVRRVNCVAASCACLPELVDDIQAMAEIGQISFVDRKNELLFSTRIHALNHQISDVYVWITLLKEGLLDMGVSPDSFEDESFYFNDDVASKVANEILHGKRGECVES